MGWDRQRAASLLKVETGNCAFVLFAYKERRDFRRVLDLTEGEHLQGWAAERCDGIELASYCGNYVFISSTKIYVSWYGFLWIDVI